MKNNNFKINKTIIGETMSYKKVILLFLFLGSSFAFAQNNANTFKSFFNQKMYSEAVKYAQAASAESPKDQNLQIQIGDAFLEVEKVDSALVYFLKADDIKDDLPQVLRRIGRCYSIKGDTKQALKILNNAISEDKKQIDSYIELADHYIRNKDLANAEKEITRAEKLAPKDPKVKIAFGDMYFEQGVYELSKNSYNEALQLDPNIIVAREKLAESYNWLGARETADMDLKNEYYKLSLEEWTNVAKADTNNAKAYFNIGKILYFSKQYAQALPSLIRYTKMKPEIPTARWFMALSFIELNAPDSALPHLIYSAKNIDSVKYKATVEYARTLFSAKKYKESIDEFNGIFASKDSNYDSVLVFNDYTKVGQAYLNIKDTTKSLETYTALIAKYPNQSCGLTYATGRFAIAAKKYDQAINLFLTRLNNETCKVEGKDSLESQIRYYMGTSYLYSANYDKALEEFNKSVALDAKQLSIYSSIAETYLQKGDKENATLNYRKYIEMAKVDSKANKGGISQSYQRLCGFAVDAKDVNKLNEIAKEWSEVTPDVPTAFFYLAVSYQSLKDAKNACESYKKVLELDPNNAKATDAITKLKCK